MVITQVEVNEGFCRAEGITFVVEGITFQTLTSDCKLEAILPVNQFQQEQLNKNLTLKQELRALV